MTEDQKPIRAALVTSPATELSTLRNYLPGCYDAVDVARGDEPTALVIYGRDVAGWTLDGYVRPRLLSGLHGTEELDVIRGHVTVNGRPIDVDALAAWEHDDRRDGAGCSNCGAYSKVNAECYCRECWAEL